MNRKFEKGERYRPVVKVTKVKKDVPTVVEMSARRYILEHKDQRSKKPMEVAEWT